MIYKICTLLYVCGTNTNRNKNTNLFHVVVEVRIRYGFKVQTTS